MSIGFAIELAASIPIGTASAAGANSVEQADVPITITTKNGFSLLATPEGDRYLVADEVDPDGFIRDHEGVRSLSADVPPSCATATAEPPGNVTQTVRVGNGCAVEQRVKVLVAVSNDSSCMILAPGAEGVHAFNILPDYLPYPGVEPRCDGLEAC